MQKRKLILMDGKGLDISSKRKNNLPEPLNNPKQDKSGMQRNIGLASSYQEIISKLWNLTRLTITATGMMLQRLNGLHTFI